MSGTSTTSYISSLLEEEAKGLGCKTKFEQKKAKAIAEHAISRHTYLAIYNKWVLGLDVLSKVQHKCNEDDRKREKI
jgi:hypothetical protein